MSTQDLAIKFRTYTQYVTSHMWFKEQRVLPYLLVIVPGKEQEMRIPRLVEAFFVNAPELVIHTTTATRLADRRSLAEIWNHVPLHNMSKEMVSRSRFFTESLLHRPIWHAIGTRSFVTRFQRQRNQRPLAQCYSNMNGKETFLALREEEHFLASNPESDATFVKVLAFHWLL